MSPEALAKKIAEDRRASRRPFWYLSLALLVMLAALPFIWCWSATRQWKKIKAEYEAAGETLDLAKLKTPPVDDEQNVFGLDDFYKPPRPVSGHFPLPEEHAFDLFNEYPIWDGFSLEDATLLSPADFDAWCRDYVNLSLEGNDQEAMKSRASALIRWIDSKDQSLLKATARLDLPHAAFRQRLSSSDPVLPYQFKYGVNARGLASLMANDTNRLVESLRLWMRYTEAQCTGPLSPTTPIIWPDLLWAALQEVRLNEGQLALLLDGIRRLHPSEDALRSLRNLAAAEISMIEDVQSRSKTGAPPFNGWERFLPASSYDWCRAKMLAFHFEFIQSIKKGGLAGLYPQVEEAKNPFWMNLVHSRAFPWVFGHPAISCYNIHGRIKTHVLFQTKLDLARIALSAELFHHQHGKYPETVELLVPAFLPAVPLDLIDGKPLRYKLDGSRYRIWSVGNNQVDDGGKFYRVSGNGSGWRYSRHQGDWVWFYPAKP